MADSPVPWSRDLLTTLSALAVLTVLIAPTSGADDACPSARQVNEAMQARFPAQIADTKEVLERGRTIGGARGDLLRPAIDIAPDGTVVRFSLIDARGEAQLRRTLAGPGRTPAVADCLALADTIAAIVERYLAGIPYVSEPGTFGPGGGDPVVTSPPLGTDRAPRRRFLPLLGLGWRTTTGAQGPTDQSGPELAVGLQFDITRGTSRLAGQVMMGAAPVLNLEVPGGVRTATVYRFPLRAGLLLAVPAGPGWVDSGLRTGTDLLIVRSPAREQTPAGSVTRFGPVLEAGIAYRLPLVRRFFVRPGLLIGLPLTVYDIRVPRTEGESAADSDRIVATPRAYASIVLDVAALFE